jgi:hypothetical protein
MLLAADCHIAAIARIDSGDWEFSNVARFFIAILLRFSSSAARTAVLAALHEGHRLLADAKALRSRFVENTIGPIGGASSVRTRDIVQLHALLADLRPLITRPSTPPDLPTDMRLSCFASRLHSLPPADRPSLAPPDVFRLFTNILSLVPPPPLVDAICSTMDAVLRQPPETNKYGGVIVAEQVNTDYAGRVCTQALAKALCDLVALGPEYASSALFGALRYFVDTAEFKTLAGTDYAKLIDLSDSDDTGLIRTAAYAALPFPKPDFPLGQECVPLGSSLSFLFLLLQHSS